MPTDMFEVVKLCELRDERLALDELAGAFRCGEQPRLIKMTDIVYDGRILEDRGYLRLPEVEHVRL